LSSEVPVAIAQQAVELVPRMRERLADLETPVSAFAKLAHLDGAFLLESVEGGEHLGRYSFIGVLPRERFAVGPGQDAVRLLRQTLARYRRERVPGLPRFAGGAVGYVSYEAVRAFERVPAAERDVLAIPVASFGVYDTVVAFDHVRRTMRLIAHAERGEGVARADARLDELAALLDRPAGLAPSAGGAGEWRSNVTRDRFESAVRKAVELIHAGDCIQIVLSQRFTLDDPPDVLSLYRALRSVNPSPFMFLVRDAGATLIGASPEPFLRVEGRRLRMYPIAGTRPRGSSDAEDVALERELRESEKERAEHVMLVDLARNDLGRVSEMGSVRVPEFMRVDRFSHVMHLTSIVEGTLRADLDALDAFRACFPAGTVSGAPKVRAMQRIAELEADRRGPYAGAVGYADFDGNLDTCIAIRTGVVAGGALHVQAGAGIVADSDPAAEYEETIAKSNALRRAVELARSIAA
jgi:anthranilate synthase component 1